MKFETMMNEELLNKLSEVETEEEVLQAFKEYNVSFEDAAAFIEQVQNGSGELSEDDLDSVSGGAILQKIFVKNWYRFYHQKFFVKAVVDKESRTITVTNRFGKEKITETYSY